MRRELLMPKLGLTMTEGVLVEWLLKPGDAFTLGQAVFLVESEKAVNEVTALDSGTLLEITAQEGQTLACGEVVGWWDDGHGETATTLGDLSARTPVTPLARRLSIQNAIRLDGIVGSGPRGRIRARDVLAAVGENVPSRADSAIDQTAIKPAVIEITEGVTNPRGRLRSPTNAERTVAQRLCTAKQQIPHFYLSVEAEMTAAIALRGQINASQTHKKLTLNHFVLAAVGRALQAIPDVNCIWTDDGILTLSSSDVGMAVSTDKGLLVPVLRDVGRHSLGDIATQASELIGQAHAARLSSADMCGGAITVSNAGMHDVTYMTSIINPGQSMILGVGSIRSVFRPDENEQPVVRREMGMVLSADHRVIDGVLGLTFLKHVVKSLEQPLSLFWE